MALIFSGHQNFSTFDKSIMGICCIKCNIAGCYVQNRRMSDTINNLDFVFKLIENYDQRRASVSARSSIVLSASAILLAIVSLVVGQLNTADYDFFVKNALKISAISTVICLLVSIILATNGIGNTWFLANKKFTVDSDQGEIPISRLIFYPRGTMKYCSDFHGFNKYLENTEKTEFLKEAKGQLFIVMNEYHSRYQKMRWAIRFMTFATIPLVFLVLMLLLQPK